MTPLTLADGRQLDVEVSGPEAGPTLVFHHGTPGSVVQVQTMRRAVHERGLRLVTYSRPGYGSSTRQEGRDVASVADDVRELLEQLGVRRCLVAGWSGGGPHALATAARLADRVAGVLVIAGVAPSDADGLDFLAGMGEQNVEEFGFAFHDLVGLRGYLTAEAAQLRVADGAGIVAALSSLLPEPDGRVLTGELGDDLAAGFAEGLRAGVDGWFDDDVAFVRPWGFALDELVVPTFLWQGELDLMVPAGHGRWLASHLPGVTAHLQPGEGHLSIGIGALGSMLDELVDVL